jgi:hypothetical protein
MRRGCSGMVSAGTDKDVTLEIMGERDRVRGLRRSQVFLTFLFLCLNVFFCLLVFSFLFPYFFFFFSYAGTNCGGNKGRKKN